MEWSKFGFNSQKNAQGGENNDVKNEKGYSSNRKKTMKRMKWKKDWKKNLDAVRHHPSRKLLVAILLPLKMNMNKLSMVSKMRKFTKLRFTMLLKQWKQDAG